MPYYKRTYTSKYLQVSDLEPGDRVPGLPQRGHQPDGDGRLPGA